MFNHWKAILTSFAYRPRNSSKHKWYLALFKACCSHSVFLPNCLIEHQSVFLPNCLIEHWVHIQQLRRYGKIGGTKTSRRKFKRP